MNDTDKISFHNNNFKKKFFRLGGGGDSKIVIAKIFPNMIFNKIKLNYEFSVSLFVEFYICKIFKI